MKNGDKDSIFIVSIWITLIYCKKKMSWSNIPEEFVTQVNSLHYVLFLIACALHTAEAGNIHKTLDMFLQKRKTNVFLKQAEYMKSK